MLERRGLAVDAELLYKIVANNAAVFAAIRSRCHVDITLGCRANSCLEAAPEWRKLAYSLKCFSPSDKNKLHERSADYSCSV